MDWEGAGAEYCHQFHVLILIQAGDLVQIMIQLYID